MNTPLVHLTFSEHIHSLVDKQTDTRTGVVTDAMRLALRDREVLKCGLDHHLKSENHVAGKRVGMRLDPALVSQFRAFASNLGLPIEVVLALAIEGYLATRQPVNSTV